MGQHFTRDPARLAALDGQQFILLRPRDAVAAEFERARGTARGMLGSAVPYAGAGHVTLRGFAEGRRVDSLLDAARGWAASLAPIEVAVEASSVLPAPFQILHLRLARTPSLVAAYAGLTEALAATDFIRIEERSLAEWVFHLSVAYCDRLDVTQWRAVSDAWQGVTVSRAAETLMHAEFVWYDRGEHREEVSLGG